MEIMKASIFSLLLILLSSITLAQNTAVGVGTVNPHPSAELEISSTKRGLLPPRMSSQQRDSIVDPAVGLQIFNTSTNCLQMFVYGTWQDVFCGKAPDTIPATLSNGLVGYWPFNGNANDESGNGNHGTVNGATLITDRFGNANKAYGFNKANGNFILVGNNPLFNGTSSISGWFYSIDPAGGPLVHIGSDNSTVGNCNGYFIGLGSTDYFSGSSISIAASCIGSLNTGVNALSSTWYHFILVRNASTLIVYINGFLVGTKSFNNINIPANNIFFGSTFSSNSAFFNGKLDDIRIYNRALTQAEITYLATH